ncbi:hypothetical protein LKO27_03480 [Tessaracoccus sp. OS52]|uniref:hypothetical protein n=1 Tax=Tessaracoccus sp. OS52 TaxID=2886691 RepID=UPI001D10FE2E|nr:hypothetical protein [Tessaracoccus sp. OS52]MCC2592483.1 hypothetical protein [Tessaracoccus sp. OS52]
MTRSEGDRGAISVWVSVAMVGFVVCVGLGVDFAGHAAAEQHVRAVAAEAARAGGQFLETRPGTRPRPDVYAATRAATAYVAASDFTGSATVDAGVIRVSVSGSYRTQFLGIIGVDSLPLRGDGAAAVTPVIDGEES